MMISSGRRVAKRRGAAPDAWEVYATTTASPQTIGVFSTYANHLFIDWGDGSAVEDKTGGTSTPTEHTHEYSTAGNYVIKLSGECERLYFYAATNSTKIKGFGQIGGLTGRSGVLNLTDCFRSCTGLSMANLPEYPFQYVGDVVSTLPRFIFGTGLSGALPSKFFGGLTKSGCTLVSACEALTGINSLPADLFFGSTGISALGGGTAGASRGCFHGCTGITAIPSGLFSPLTALVDGTGIFRSCTGINTAIPSTLFDHLDGTLDQVDFMFSGCASIPGQSYKFWDWDTEPTTTADCYLSCSSLDDYATIPAAYL